MSPRQEAEAAIEAILGGEGDYYLADADDAHAHVRELAWKCFELGGRSVVVNRLLTQEEIDLDLFVRGHLCSRPSTGTNAQSIDEAAVEILEEHMSENSRHLIPRRARAALACLDVMAEPDPWARLRRVAAILRGDS